TALLLNLSDRVPMSRRGFPLVDGFVNGIQVSPCAGIDNVRAGRLPAKTLSFKVNVDKNLADGILSAAYRMHGVVNQPSRQRRDSIDCAIDCLNGTISIGGFNERLIVLAQPDSCGSDGLIPSRCMHVLEMVAFGNNPDSVMNNCQQIFIVNAF